MTASASCEGTEPLSGLKSIRDAKEVVLYQYAVCPFCNKVRPTDRRCRMEPPSLGR